MKIKIRKKCLDTERKINGKRLGLLFFDVSLTVHLGKILVINQLNAQILVS